MFTRLPSLTMQAASGTQHVPNSSSNPSTQLTPSLEIKQGTQARDILRAQRLGKQMKTLAIFCPSGHAKVEQVGKTEESGGHGEGGGGCGGEGGGDTAHLSSDITARLCTASLSPRLLAMRGETKLVNQTAVVVRVCALLEFFATGDSDLMPLRGIVRDYCCSLSAPPPSL
ncbi:hypothetical protein BaRGS_00012860 [Batillaria attramentaria]|uniref:Uncharacterized protein n=1 Tax=Batillaria attramentaria TaxID=370345 RepID=A0ABD0L993_9CAEN